MNEQLLPKQDEIGGKCLLQQPLQEPPTDSKTVVCKVWSRVHHLGTSQKCRVSSPNPDLPDWGTAICFNKLARLILLHVKLQAP